MTKKMIKDAMLELLENQPLEKISVTDICTNADVNRSTFYAYYTDTAHLLTEIENDVLDQIPKSPEHITNASDVHFLDALETFFDYVQENERLFRILMIQRDSSSFNLRLINAVMEKYQQPLATKSRATPHRKVCIIQSDVI